MSDQKTAAMRAGGKKLASVLAQVTQAVKPGVSLSQLDQLTDKLIIQSGGEAGFKLVPGYHWATCINLNEGIVHGIPHHHIKLKPGDIVSIDMGMFFQGFHTDTSTTIVSGTPTHAQNQFLQVGKKALSQAISQAKVNHRVGNISQAIQQIIEKAGFNCVRNLTGHGIGKKLHQPPMIPCVLKGSINKTPKLRLGMTLAIEIIYAQKSATTAKLKDDWTLITKDNSPSGLFEHTVLITKNGPEILTKL